MTTSALHPRQDRAIDGIGLSVADDSEFQRYYEESGPDYEAWSPNFNMHFGYCTSKTNPFHREAMLEEMNRQVLLRLHAANLAAPQLLDMGCGVGATMRSLVRRLPAAQLTGVTLVPWQLQQGAALNQAADSAARLHMLLRDYQQTGLPAASMDGVYALESSCYARHADKRLLLREAHRLLRPGGRLVIADGFLLRPNGLHGPQRAIFRRLCRCWAIDTLGVLPAFTAELASLGFREITVEQVQSRVAASVLHVPWVTIRFLLSKVLFRSRKMTRARWNNLLAPLLLPFVSKPLGPMSYCIVSATRT